MICVQRIFRFHIVFKGKFRRKKVVKWFAFTVIRIAARQGKIKEKLNFLQVGELLGIFCEASENFAHLTPVRGILSKNVCDKIEVSYLEFPKMHFCSKNFEFGFFFGSKISFGPKKFEKSFVQNLLKKILVKFFLTNEAILVNFS